MIVHYHFHSSDPREITGSRSDQILSGSVTLDESGIGIRIGFSRKKNMIYIRPNIRIFNPLDESLFCQSRILIRIRFFLEKKLSISDKIFGYATLDESGVSPESDPDPHPQEKHTIFGSDQISGFATLDKSWVFSRIGYTDQGGADSDPDSILEKKKKQYPFPSTYLDL